MTLNDSVVAVAGANGFLGRALCEALAANGAVVRAMVRDPEKNDDLAHVARGGIFKCDLAGEVDPSAISPPLRSLIHCAYIIDDATNDAAQRHNIQGTRQLLALCQSQQATQFIFISSLAAHAQARSGYGRTKWLLENEILAAGGTVIKPGTILGTGGVYGRARALIRKLPIVPVFYSRGRKIQTVLVDELCSAVLNAIDRDLRGTFIAAEPMGVPPVQFYRGTAALEGKKRLLLPIMGNPALVMIGAAERIGLRLPITSDNLLGLKYLQHFDTADSEAKLGIRFGDFWSSLQTLAARENNPEAMQLLKSLRRQ